MSPEDEIPDVEFDLRAIYHTAGLDAVYAAGRLDGGEDAVTNVLTIIERARPTNPRDDWTEYAEGMDAAVTSITRDVAVRRQHPEAFEPFGQEWTVPVRRSTETS